MSISILGGGEAFGVHQGFGAPVSEGRVLSAGACGMRLGLPSRVYEDGRGELAPPMSHCLRVGAYPVVSLDKVSA